MSQRASMTRILGVDPGSHRTGFAIIEDRQGELVHLNHGVLVLDSEMSLPARLSDLADSLRELMQKYSPHHVAVEKIFLGKSAESAFRLGHARGVVLAEASRAGAEVFEYATRAVKKAVTGTGAASKEEVQLALQRSLRLDRLVSLDGSDALALTVLHAQKLRCQQAERLQSEREENAFVATAQARRRKGLEL